MKNTIVIILILFSFSIAFSQVEHVPIANPIYQYLLRAETKGYLPHFSLANLPLQKKEIIKALELIRENYANLSKSDKETLERYERQFFTTYYPEYSEITKDNSIVLFYSDTDSTQLFSNELFGEKEKFFYRYADSVHTAFVTPLGEIDVRYTTDYDGASATLANAGARFYGTLSNSVGYFLQATNGAQISGNRDFALEDPRLSQNNKFKNLKSDFDLTESHVRYDNDWFYAIIGRESRMMGAGLNQNVFISTSSPASDAISLGARFSNFEYRFSHFSLVGFPENDFVTGFYITIPPKYTSMHRISFRPSWGEISLWESVVYSDRQVELAYLNPLRFLKTIEHTLRDRDNSAMGFDATIRPFDGMQLKGSFLLDDIIIERIGTGFWSNKTAWNIAAIYSFSSPIDFGIEYARVEPYTFTHFNRENSMTNDGLLFGSNILPNSDQISALMQYWFGGRYPLFLKASFTRHGANIVDENGNMIRNVGGDYLETMNWFRGDSETVKFLDGDLTEILDLQIGTAWEFVRGFHLHGLVRHRIILGDKSDTFFRIVLRFDDF